MDEKGTKIDTTMQIRLTSVRPDKTCRLIGVSERDQDHPRHQGRHRRGRRGWFFGNPERQAHRQAKWEERQKRWEEKRQTWEEGKKEWYFGGGRGITKRLLDLGLTKGCTFKVIQSSSNGPVLVEVRGTRIALGHELARRVIVEVLEN
ncbi:MAG: ferrous iron transport protein A [Candidatus Thorarchaeota archaeon]